MCEIVYVQCALTLYITCKRRSTYMEKRLTPFTFQFAPYLLQTVGWDVFFPTGFTFDMKGCHNYVVGNLMKWKRKKLKYLFAFTSVKELKFTLFVFLNDDGKNICIYIYKRVSKYTACSIFAVELMTLIIWTLRSIISLITKYRLVTNARKYIFEDILTKCFR